MPDEINCIRKACIEDPHDPYHQEKHYCFVCGAEFMPDHAMLEQDVCPDCGWYMCPECDGCQCSLGEYDRAWMSFLRNTFCKNVNLMAALEPEMLPPTQNPNVRKGMAQQLMYCQQWARRVNAEVLETQCGCSR